MEESLNPLKIIKLPGMDKIKWRYKEHEIIQSSRWHRKHSEQAEFYYFWEIECRNFPMYIPLEEQYNFESAFKMIEVPELIMKIPTSTNKE